MKIIIGSVLFVATMIMSGLVSAEAQPGRDYTLLNEPQPTTGTKIEVLEFFFYECPHCFHLHPLLAAWEKNIPKDVALSFVPTIFRESTEPLARTYYSLESMGKIKQLDDEIYQAIHVKNIDLHDASAIADFVAQHGVDKAKFSDAYGSFAVQSKVARAKQMIRSYAIAGTPTLVVDGKYVITGMGPKDLIRALDEVVAKVRKERSGKSADAQSIKPTAKPA
ncbi:MAG TPA: thiol:disulfide interchange protein DsbA/DsbL [Gallionella sp.]|nr:thiol:disulfide interchange protein DsbA/DsbL [Gallionella sp.]